MSFENSIRAAVAEFPIHYVLKDLTGFICIIGDNSATKSEFKQKILSTFTKISEQYQERFEFVIGLGKIVGSPFALSASYAQAQKALEYRFLFPAQNILEASAIPGFDPKLILNQENNEDKLIELLCKNNMDGIRDWIGKGYLYGFYDAYAPQARELFWQQMQDHYYPLGIDAWWMDASEPNIRDCTDMDYRKARNMMSSIKI